MHGLNEGHIAPYTDIEFQLTKYQTYIIMKSQYKYIINKIYKDTVEITAVNDGVILLYGLRRWTQKASNRSQRLQMRSLNFTVKEGNTKVTLCSVTPAERS